MTRAKKGGEKSKDRRLEELQSRLQQKGSSLSTPEKEEYLQRKFRLLRNPLLKTPSDLRMATQTLMEFWDLFSHA